MSLSHRGQAYFIPRCTGMVFDGAYNNTSGTLVGTGKHDESGSSLIHRKRFPIHRLTNSRFGATVCIEIDVQSKDPRTLAIWIVSWNAGCTSDLCHSHMLTTKPRPMHGISSELPSRPLRFQAPRDPNDLLVTSDGVICPFCFDLHMASGINGFHFRLGLHVGAGSSAA